MAGSIAIFKGSSLRAEGEIGSGCFGAIIKAWSEEHQKYLAVKYLLNCRNLPLRYDTGIDPTGAVH